MPTSSDSLSPGDRLDQQLVEAINRGDTSAFETLYCRHRDWTWRLAWRFTGNTEDAADVVQETFTYLLRKFPGFTLSARMTTFLYPVVRHIGQRIRDKRQRESQDETAFIHLADSRQGERAEARSELAAAIRALPPAQREVVLMRFVDAMSLDEIARALELPLGTVKSRLHHALRTLRDDPRARRYFAIER